MADENQSTNGAKKPNGKPISLYPLTVEQVVKAMLETPPPPKKEATEKKPSH